MYPNLRPISDAHDFQTRSSHNLIIPRHRSSKYEKSLLYSGIKLWNKQPIELRKIESCSIFKNKISTMLSS